MKSLDSRIQPWSNAENAATAQSNAKTFDATLGIEELKLSQSFFEIDEKEFARALVGASQQCSNKPIENEREILLYLIRHGETEHNVLEKIAMQEALDRSIQETGMGKDFPETAKTMVNARKAVLSSETLRDAKLSDLGRAEAHDANKTLSAICEQAGFEPPARVLVSPLTRTLETASIVFPEHDCGCKIHVREDLSERKTGKPPDTRSSVGTLSLRKSFHRFSMNQLSEESMVVGGYGTTNSSTNKAMSHEETASEPSLAQDLDENRDELRKRTHRLFDLLGETNHTSVAVVTHKAYLRELEKGPMKQGESVKEFKTCEIRVYRIRLSMLDDKLVHAERVH